MLDPALRRRDDVDNEQQRNNQTKSAQEDKKDKDKRHFGFGPHRKRQCDSHTCCQYASVTAKPTVLIPPYIIEESKN
jgi:hypothetical protein